MQSSDKEFQTTQESPHSQLRAASRVTYPNEEVTATVGTSRWGKVDQECRPKRQRASDENLRIHSRAARRAKKTFKRITDTILSIFRPLASKNHGGKELYMPSLSGLKYMAIHGQSGTPSSTPGHQLVDGSRLWAVLIGIDAYTQHPLRGCVSDALLMKSYLISNLGTPENRIQCLLGSKYPQNPTEPSRANIVDTLYSLVDNAEIERDDNIVIYYAGHGSSYDSFCGSKLGVCGVVEALCPIDRDTLDSGGNWTPDISERELDCVFSQICHSKGHKITFILDCSFSSSFSRQPLADAQIRSIHPTSHASLDDMLHAAHERWKGLPDHRSILSRDWEPDMDSHVVLAACQEHQTAKEVEGPDGFNGVFTKTLVHVLRDDWKEETTYVDLVDLMNQSPFQTPIVAGKRMMERLWYTHPH